MTLSTFLANLFLHLIFSDYGYAMGLFFQTKKPNGSSPDCDINNVAVVNKKQIMSNQRPQLVDNGMMGALVEMSHHKDIGKKKAREEHERTKIERARQRREEKRLNQERRDLVTHLVRLIRDDATPHTLSLCGTSTNAAGGDGGAGTMQRHAVAPKQPTIEDMLGTITAEELAKICQVLPRNRSLEHLNIRRNQFHGASMLPLHNALVAVHSNLLTLDVSRNPLGSVGVLHLANAIEDNSRLTSLIACGVRATDDGATVEAVVALAQALERNTTLTRLDFASNNITDFTGKMEGMARIAAALEQNFSLCHLDLSDNCIGEIGAQLLEHCIVKNTSLTKLELGMNRLGPGGGMHIAKLVQRRSLLVLADLGMADNEMCGLYGPIKTSESLFVLSHALEKHETLTRLDLRRNGTTSDGGRSIAESLRRNTALRELFLGGGEDQVTRDFISNKLIQTRTRANRMLFDIIAGNNQIDHIDRKKQTALHVAADAGSVDVARRLLQLHAQSDLRNFRSLTPLHCAVESRDAPMITELLCHGDVDLSLCDSVGDTCLHKAVRAGDGALAALLILKGADMEQRNNAGFRALGKF